MDEVQLMGPGLVTTVQLQGFREKMGSYGPIASAWMSATLNPEDFITIDAPFRNEDLIERTLHLEKDLESQVVRLRLEARKTLHRCEVTFGRETQNDYAKALAAELKARHKESGGLTIVMVNRVRRAQEVISVIPTFVQAGLWELLAGGPLS